MIKDQPDKPPSLAQLEIRNQTIKFEMSTASNKNTDLELFRKSLANLFKNFNFDLFDYYKAMKELKTNLKKSYDDIVCALINDF